VESKLALERYKLLEPHLQNGRELRSVSEGSNVSLTALVVGDQRVRKARCEAVTAALSEAERYPRISRSNSSRQFETALSSAKPESRHPTTSRGRFRKRIVEYSKRTRVLKINGLE
jgi:hypothetical protein